MYPSDCMSFSILRTFLALVLFHIFNILSVKVNKDSTKSHKADMYFVFHFLIFASSKYNFFWTPSSLSLDNRLFFFNLLAVAIYSLYITFYFLIYLTVSIRSKNRAITHIFNKSLLFIKSLYILDFSDISPYLIRLCTASTLLTTLSKRKTNSLNKSLYFLFVPGFSMIICGAIANVYLSCCM